MAGSLPVLLNDGSRKYVWGLGLEHAVDSSGNVEVFHADGLGSVRTLTDASGTVTQAVDTDEFGAVTRTQGGSAQPFGFTGELRDPTGLVYLRARIYDPGLGRFLQRDPFAGALGVPLTLNRFTYVENNPLTLTDPSGYASAQATNGILRDPIDCTDRSNWLSRYACQVPDAMTSLGARVRVPSEVRDLSDKLAGIGQGGSARQAMSGGADGGGSTLRNVYARKSDVPKWPADPTRHNMKQVKVNNRELLAKLREVEPGDWVKVYENTPSTMRSSDGQQASLQDLRGAGSGCLRRRTPRRGPWA